MQSRFEKTLAVGALLGAVLIWAGWMVQTRFLSLGVMNLYDLTALRFAFAAAVLFPVLIKKGPVVQSVGKSLALTAALGAPYVLIVAYGMQLAPASQASAIINGAMVATSALLGALILKEKISRPRAIGVSVLIFGMGLLVFTRASGSFNLGHLVFGIGGLLWSTYTILGKKWKVDPIHATAVVAVYSAVFYLPIYLVFLKPAVASLPASTLLIHGFYQGVLVSGAALFLFSLGVARLGASTASLFMPLVPLITLFLGATFLKEIPTERELVAIALVVSGLLVSSFKTTSALTVKLNLRKFLAGGKITHERHLGHAWESSQRSTPENLVAAVSASCDSLAHVKKDCAGQSR